MKFSFLTCFLFALILCASGQASKWRMIGNDFGWESLVVQDDLVESRRYRGQSFSPLNVSYYRFASQSIFQVGLSYHQRRPDDEQNELRVQSFDIDLSYYRKVVSGKHLRFHLGLGNRTYFTYMNFRDLEDSYDMGIISLRLASLLEAQLRSIQVLFDVGFGLVKYGSRAGYDWILGVDDGFSQKWTSFNSFSELTMNLRANVPLTSKWVLSPSWRLFVARNHESEPLALIRNQVSVGIFFRL
ncbi:MAG: hypothetical protein AAGA85_18820 [Bacteroidota bacterium]